MMAPTSRSSAGPMPRVVSAAVPMRTPEVTVGGRSSKGTPFLFTVMPARSSRSSPSLPVRGVAERSTSTRWLSVPPVTRATPFAMSTSAMAAQLSTVRCWRSRNSGVRHWPNAMALPAITCISGPPCSPGNTARSMALANSSSHMMNPARGPPRVLCMVEVTTCAIPTGLGCAPPATRPEIWAMSTIRRAPTSSAISRNAGKSSVRG